MQVQVFNPLFGEKNGKESIEINKKLIQPFSRLATHIDANFYFHVFFIKNMHTFCLIKRDTAAFIP